MGKLQENLDLMRRIGGLQDDYRIWLEELGDDMPAELASDIEAFCQEFRITKSDMADILAEDLTLSEIVELCENGSAKWEQVVVLNSRQETKMVWIVKNYDKEFPNAFQKAWEKSLQYPGHEYIMKELGQVYDIEPVNFECYGI